MSNVGYARVSSAGQSIDIQLAALKAVGCDVIRSEKVRETATQGRTELRTILDFVRKGDVLTVTRIDRLARSITDLAAIVRELERKGAALKAIEQRKPLRCRTIAKSGALFRSSVLHKEWPIASARP